MIKTYKYILIALTSMLLAACTVGKKYERKPLDLPESFRETVSVTADSVQLPWKTFFHDPLLVALIEKALVKNNEVAVAVLSMQQLDLNYKQARLQMLPTVDFSLAANRSWLSKNSLNGSLSEQFIGTPYMDDYNAGFNVAWEADIWRKVKMQKEDALSQYFMQKENLSALQTRIIAQVAQAYYQLIALDEQLEIADRNVQLSDSTLQMVMLQYNSAQVSSVAVGQAEAQKKTAELLIPLAKQNIAVQENALSILCGEYPSAVERSGSLDEALEKEVFGLGVPANLLSRRPDVKAAEYAVMSSNAKTGLAKANMYPALSISASSAANSFNFKNWFSIPGSIVKNLGVNVAQPVFRRNALKTAYETAQLEQEKAVKQFEQSVLVAVGEVSDALVIIKHSDERLALVADRKASLDNATKDALLLFNNAIASYLEVITAQNNALQNELEAISIKKEKLDAITNLYRAVGGGVE